MDRPSTLEADLERGELAAYPSSPFALPEGGDLDFLTAQEITRLGHKNISYDPVTRTLTGHAIRDRAGADRLCGILAWWAGEVRRWLAEALPRYAAACRPDRVSFNPLEEATRKARPTARNDLLHIDAFPSRPSQGWRILRVFANVHPTEPRVWATAEPFARLLQRYGGPSKATAEARWGWVGLLAAGRRSTYDHFMQRFHHALKRNDEFQERGRKRLWTFPPGAAWVAMTDACAYAELRGRCVLDHSFFIPPEALALPDESPAALLRRAA